MAFIFSVGLLVSFSGTGRNSNLFRVINEKLVQIVYYLEGQIHFSTSSFTSAFEMTILATLDAPFVGIMVLRVP
jgi:hypothetical protein